MLFLVWVCLVISSGFAVATVSEGEASPLPVLIDIAAIAVPIAVVPAALVAARAMLARPHLHLQPEALSLHDAALLSHALILAPAQVASMRVLDWPDYSDDFGKAYFQMSPFNERMTHELVLTDPIRIVNAHTGLLGNWWWTIAILPTSPTPRVPSAGEMYDRIRLRLETSGSDRLGSWLSRET